MAAYGAAESNTLLNYAGDRQQVCWIRAIKASKYMWSESRFCRKCCRNANWLSAGLPWNILPEIQQQNAFFGAWYALCVNSAGVEDFMSGVILPPERLALWSTNGSLAQAGKRMRLIALGEGHMFAGVNGLSP